MAPHPAKPGSVRRTKPGSVRRTKPGPEEPSSLRVRPEKGSRNSRLRSSRSKRADEMRAGEVTTGRALKTANARLRACQRRILTLESQVARLEEARTAERTAARQRMASARRRFETRSTRMVQEIGALRHHELRARGLERTLAAKEREIKRLSELLGR